MLPYYLLTISDTHKSPVGLLLPIVFASSHSPRTSPECIFKPQSEIAWKMSFCENAALRKCPSAKMPLCEKLLCERPLCINTALREATLREAALRKCTRITQRKMLLSAAKIRHFKRPFRRFLYYLMGAIPESQTVKNCVFTNNFL